MNVELTNFPHRDCGEVRLAHVTQGKNIPGRRYCYSVACPKVFKDAQEDAVKIAGRKIVWANKEVCWLAGIHLHTAGLMWRPARTAQLGKMGCPSSPLNMQGIASLLSKCHDRIYWGIPPPCNNHMRGIPPRRSSEVYPSRPTVRASLLVRETSSTTTQEPLLKL